MKLYIFVLLMFAVFIVECSHRFVGTNVLRPLVYHHRAQYSSKMLGKRVENMYFSLPPVRYYPGRSIQGILAYDLTHSQATANITQGGIGFNFVNLRMKSDWRKPINFDVYIYA